MQPHRVFQVVVLAAALVLGWARTVPSSSSTVPSVTPTEIPKNSTPCAIDVGSLCQKVDEDHGNYMIKVGTHFFRESGELQVKVYSANCPWHMKVSPWWYQLTAVVRRPADTDTSNEHVSSTASLEPHEESTEPETIGGFIPVNHNDEIHLCNSNKRTVFSSCSPSPMDFPMMYIWKTLSKYNYSDTVCFRLLLKQDGDTACKLVQECHTISELLTNSSMKRSLIADHSVTLTNSAQLDEILREVNEANNNEQMEETLVNNLSAAAKNAVSMTGCMSTKKFLRQSGLSWEPSCDCQGNYKSVQCRKAEHDTQVCWCSTHGGSERFNTRKTLTCESAMQFEC